MSNSLVDFASGELESIHAAGTYKHERVILGSQSSSILTQTSTAAGADHHSVINLCANNYLGLANDPRLIDAAKSALDSHGFGMASVRFICGTQDLHKALEQELAKYLGTEDAIVFPSCFDANGGVFEVLLGPDDAVISDELNHASIIDGIRLCKAQRFRYRNNDMASLEQKLKDAQSARHRLVVTDGVFSMDGIVADLPGIVALAERYDAMVMVDDCHATGFMGTRGAGTADHHNVEGRVQLISGTFGKALGGASGGFVAGPAPVVDLLKQRARPYLFSNAVAPAICSASLVALQIAASASGSEARQRINDNANRFRAAMTGAGFELVPGHHAIIPVMIGEASLAARFADELLGLGVYVIAFSYPVVPQGKARIRTQMSASHTSQQLDIAIDAFITAGKKLGIIS